MVELTPDDRAFLKSLPRTVHLFADTFEHHERETLLKMQRLGLCHVEFGPVSSMCLNTTQKGRAALASAKLVAP